MITGLYSAFTALESAWHYQDALANNIANATTPGFKREIAARESFADVLLSRQTPIPAPISARVQDVVGQIGTGSFVAEFVTDYGHGAFQVTNNNLDFALEDGFFAVESTEGGVFFTRDGRFGRDANGDLVTSHGYYVLDEQGAHIRLPEGDLAVGPEGDIEAADGTPFRLMVMDFTPQQLVRAGESYFTSETAGTPVVGGLRQGILEMSNSNMVEEITTLMSVRRTFQANQTLLARLDSTLDLAAGQVGSVRA